MQCPHCGVDTEAAKPTCKACGKSLQVSAADAVMTLPSESALMAESTWGPRLLHLLIGVIAMGIVLGYGASRMKLEPPGEIELVVPAVDAPEPTFPMPSVPKTLPRADLIQPTPVPLPALPVLRIAFGSRDPRVRLLFLERNGGGKDTEAAVERGLQWLKRNQRPDGSWDCESLDGRAEFTVGVSGLALLAYLGAGHTHLSEGPYKDTVDKALRYLLGQQDAGGRFPGRLYHQGICTMAIVEAFGMTGDASLEAPSTKAIEAIVAAQAECGGWDYGFTSGANRGDTSVTGWQVMALKSAKRVYISFPESVLEKAKEFLDGLAQYDGTIAYDNKRDPFSRDDSSSSALTAAGLNALLFAGAETKEEIVQRAIGVLLRNVPFEPKATGQDRWSPSANIYLWYHAALAISRLGGPEWRFYNALLKPLLLKLQKQDGSWDTTGDRWASSGGRLYFTTLAILALEVYYRYD